MLPRRLRLPRAGFAAQKAHAVKARLTSSHFSLTIAPSQPKKGGIAVVISAKAVPKAVDRHRLKRQLMPMLKPLFSPARALVLHARPGVASLTAAELRAEVRSLAERGLNIR